MFKGKRATHGESDRDSVHSLVYALLIQVGLQKERNCGIELCGESQLRTCKFVDAASFWRLALGHLTQPRFAFSVDLTWRNLRPVSHWVRTRVNRCCV